MKKTLITRIDCCTKPDPETFWESHPSEIIHSPLGDYRQTPPIHYSRFAYRFKIAHPQKPHQLVVTYPDNASRNIEILNGLNYDLSTGIGTGFEQPVSNTMKRHVMTFWPRSSSGEVMILNYAYQNLWDFQPAAVQSIEVYELNTDHLPSAGITGNGRKIGFQWEDPCGNLVSLGARNISEWAERVGETALAAGQNIIQYNASWYWGPLYPSEVATPDNFQMAQDEKTGFFGNVEIVQYADWLGDAIKIWRRQGLAYEPILHLLRLSPLIEIGKQQLQDGVTGPECIFNIRSDGTVQRTLADWTSLFTQNHCHDWEQWGAPVGHEKAGVCDIPTGPMYNILHPKVQEVLTALFREWRSRYGTTGATVPLWGTTMLWFGTEKSGYDDTTCSLFEQETGHRIPVSSGPERFARRAEYLLNNCREEWLAWRCRAIKRVLDKLAEVLGGPLTLSFCHEPFLQHVTPESIYANAKYQLGNPGRSVAELCLAGGLDFSLYGTGNVHIEFQQDPSRPREQHREDYPMLYREYNFLDKTEKLPDGAYCSHYFHNAYLEGGSYKYCLIKKDLPEHDWGLGKIRSCYQQELHFNHPIWPWYPAEFTTGPGLPPCGRHFLEAYTHALAVHDVRKITHGGLTIGIWGHEVELREFSKVFRSIPDAAFSAVGTSTDPAAVRQLKRKDGLYVYIVNSSDMPVSVKLHFPGKVRRIVSLPQNKELKNNVFRLKPYGLRLLKIDGTSSVSDFTVHVSEVLLNQRIAEAEKLLAEWEKESSGFDAGRKQYGDRIAGILRDAIRKNEFSTWKVAAFSLYVAIKKGLLKKQSGK